MYTFMFWPPIRPPGRCPPVFLPFPAFFWKRVLTNPPALAIINKLDSYERDQAK